MSAGPDEKLDRLLREAFPAVEVSPDFTLRLWRGLMKSPVRPPWMPPIPVLELAAVSGVLAGIWTSATLLHPALGFSQPARLDLYGNAPMDTVAGSYLNLMREG